MDMSEWVLFFNEYGDQNGNTIVLEWFYESRNIKLNGYLIEFLSYLIWFWTPEIVNIIIWIRSQVLKCSIELID